MDAMFYYCQGLTSLDVSNFSTSNVTTFNNMFYYCNKLVDLDISNFDASKVINIGSMISNCALLENLKYMQNLGKGYTQKTNNHSNYEVRLYQSPKLTHDSLMDVINKLYDLNLTYDVANGGTLYTQKLNIGATNMAKLTEEEIAIATSKGWVVS